MGFSRLAALMPPVLAAPALMMRWHSSTNRMIFPLAALTSSRTPLMRSSSEPWNLVPATSAPMSRLHSSQSAMEAGTSPATMRWASSSTMAVFPTPPADGENKQ